MNVGLYQNASAITNLEQWQGIVSQNIAASSISGYKALQAGMEGIGMGESPEESESESEDTFADTMRNTSPTVIAARDLSPGEIVQTSVPTDVAVYGQGFFEVQQGDGTTLYTRDGQFHVNKDYVLVNKNGHEVIGKNGNIQGQPGGGEFSIDKAGRVSQGGAQIGELNIADVKDANLLTPVSGGFIAREGQQIDAVEEPRVISGAYEGSNVSSIRQMIDLIRISRSAEISNKVITTTDENMNKTIMNLGESAARR